MKLIHFGTHARVRAAREAQGFDEPETYASGQTKGTDPTSFRDPGGIARDDEAAGRERLLADCRDRVAHDIAIAFAQTQNATAEKLLALADHATLAGSQNLYSTTHGFLISHSQELLHQFRIAFVSACDASFQDPEEDARFGELSLVTDEDFERDLTIDKLSSRAVYACSQQLTALDRRIATLLPGRRLSSDRNPLYPKAIFTAFHRACQIQGANDQIDLTLLGEFSHQIADALPKIYAEINHHLKEKGVLPEIPLDAPPRYDRSRSATEAPAARQPHYDRSTSVIEAPAARQPHYDRSAPAIEAPAARQPHYDRSEAAIEAPTRGAVRNPAKTGTALLAEPVSDEDRIGLIFTTGAVEGRAPPVDVFTQIAHRLMARWPTTRSAEPSLTGGVPSPMTGQLVSALTHLQRGAPDAERFPGVDPSLHDATDGNLLRRIRNTPLIAWSHPMDAVTVDVVAMLFDLILNDSELPDALRAQIGRLQIPVLKVAMMDRGFFSNRQHPARRLLNAIAESSKGWTERDLPRLIDRVHAICETILDGFEEDTIVFSVQLEALTRFLAEEKKRASNATAARIDEVEQAERRVLARQEAAEQLRRHTASGDLPDLIRGFLEDSWRLVLIKTWLEPGEGGQARKEAIATMDELVWSIAPKTTAEERDKLFRTLPDLLRRLQQGLASVALANKWDAFFSYLLRAHMLAVRPETAAPRETPPPSQASIRAGNPAAADELIKLEPIKLKVAQPERIKLELAKPEAVPDRDERCQESAQGLRLGTWVEFTSTRGTRRAMRLDWCSQQGGAYLFANFQGDDSVIVTTERLTQRLRNHTARILDQDNFVERAVSQLLAGDGLEALAGR